MNTFTLKAFSLLIVVSFSFQTIAFTELASQTNTNLISESNPNSNAPSVVDQQNLIQDITSTQANVLTSEQRVEAEYNANGQLVSKSYFDLQNRKLKEEHFNPESGFKITEGFFDSETGNLVRYNSYYDRTQYFNLTEDRVQSEIILDRHIVGKILERKLYSAFGNLETKEVAEYDDSGNLVASHVFSASTNIEIKTKYYLDGSWARLNKSVEYENTQSHRLLKETHYVPVKGLAIITVPILVYRGLDAANAVQIDTFDKVTGNLTSRQTMDYDQSNKPINKQTFTYHYERVGCQTTDRLLYIQTLNENNERVGLKFFNDQKLPFVEYVIDGATKLVNVIIEYFNGAIAQVTEYLRDINQTRVTRYVGCGEIAGVVACETVEAGVKDQKVAVGYEEGGCSPVNNEPKIGCGDSGHRLITSKDSKTTEKIFYDKNGNKLYSTFYDAAGKVKEKMTYDGGSGYFYQQEKYQNEVIYYKKVISSSGVSVYNYDSSGRVTKITYTDFQGKILAIDTYTYIPTGQRSHVMDHYDEMGRIYQSFKYLNDTLETVELNTYYFTSNLLKTKTIYDAHGNLISFQEF